MQPPGSHNAVVQFAASLCAMTTQSLPLPRSCQGLRAGWTPVLCYNLQVFLKANVINSSTLNFQHALKLAEHILPSSVSNMPVFVLAVQVVLG